MSAADLRQLYRRWLLELWNGDLTVAEQLVTADFVVHQARVVEGDLVAAGWAGRGRYTGGIPGATAAAGTPVAFGGIDLLRARDGRFAEYWVSSDGLQLMAQLGALGPGG
jgi:predicted ester cyclase